MCAVRTSLAAKQKENARAVRLLSAQTLPSPTLLLITSPTNLNTNAISQGDELMWLKHAYGGMKRFRSFDFVQAVRHLCVLKQIPFTITLFQNMAPCNIVTTTPNVSTTWKNIHECSYCDSFQHNRMRSGYLTTLLQFTSHKASDSINIASIVGESQWLKRHRA